MHGINLIDERRTTMKYVELMIVVSRIMNCTYFKGKGITLGNQTSQHFVLFYPRELDVYVKETLRMKCYTRYMDDFLLIYKDKAYLEACKLDMEQ